MAAEFGLRSAIRRLAEPRRLIPIVAVMIILPPYVTTGFDVTRIPAINATILTHSVRREFAAVFPWFNLAALIVFLGSMLAGRGLGRLLAPFALIANVLSAFVQNVAVTELYGLAVATSTMALTLLVAASWLLEVVAHENDFSRRPHTGRLIILIPLGLLALWHPVDAATLNPSFRPSTFFTSGSALTFCMLAIMSLAVLVAYHPHVNPVTLRVTGLAGFLIGIGNLWLEFVHLPHLAWVGVLHIRLVAISAVALHQSFHQGRVPAP